MPVAMNERELAAAQGLCAVAHVSYAIHEELNYQQVRY
jgi:hypothetical protein